MYRSKESSELEKLEIIEEYIKVIWDIGKLTEELFEVGIVLFEFEKEDFFYQKFYSYSRQQNEMQIKVKVLP